MNLLEKKGSCFDSIMEINPEHKKVLEENKAIIMESLVGRKQSV
jgi:hypothetical protein